MSAMREAETTDFSLKTQDDKRSRVVKPTPPDSSLPADPLMTLPDRSCMGDPYELGGPQHHIFDRGSTWKQKAYQLRKCMEDLHQLIRLCPLRDTEHSMSMKGYFSEQNMTTVEDGYNTADGGPLQIRESSGYQEQHSRSFHETS